LFSIENTENGRNCNCFPTGRGHIPFLSSDLTSCEFRFIINELERRGRRDRSPAWPELTPLEVGSYFSGFEINKNDMGEHVARIGDKRGTHRVLVGRPDGKRPLGRPRLTWEDNIKTDLQEVTWEHGLD
jgi:hypothetical protein